MAEASRDGNYVTTLIAVSSVDGVTPVRLWADPVTHRLLVTSSGGTPGGSDTQVQFNDGGSFGGDASFTWNKTTNILTIDGGQAVTVANTANTVGLQVTQNDTTNNPDAIDIVNSTTSHALHITQTGNTSASSSVGGAVLITNTSNTGPGLVVYSNQASSGGNLVNFRVDNATFSHDGVRIDYDGTGDGFAVVATAAASNAASFSNTGVDHTINIAYTGSTAQKGAFNASSTNTGGSVFQITGNPTGFGVGKITHNAVGDADSSVLSLAATNTGYLGQGIFLDMETVGTQKILNLRADSAEKMVLNSDGTATFAGDVSVPDEVFGVAWNGSVEVPTKNAVYDKVTSLGTPVEETPTGTINGVTTAFTLSSTPIANTLQVFLNRLLQEGGGVDYTLSGTTITFVTAPTNQFGTARLRAFYRA